LSSVTDAVTNGLRDLLKPNFSSFSSSGPTDDGRIKPDLVANGDGVYSALNGGNSAYGTLGGTSMSSPNAAGTADLLRHNLDSEIIAPESTTHRSWVMPFFGQWAS